MSVDVIQIAEYLEAREPKQLIFRAINSGDVQGFIVDLNTRKQLGFFVNSEGIKLSDIGGEYSVSTQVEKGLAGDQVNLNDKGDYWESYEVIPQQDGTYVINSNPIKDGVSLEDRWGDKLEGLTDDNKREANEFIESKIWSQAEESL